MSNLYVSLEEVKKAIESCWKLSCIQDEYDMFLIRDKFDNIPNINLSEEQLDLIKKSV